jgi:hypothetical protein
LKSSEQEYYEDGQGLHTNNSNEKYKKNEKTAPVGLNRQTYCIISAICIVPLLQYSSKEGYHKVKTRAAAAVLELVIIHPLPFCDALAVAHLLSLSPSSFFISLQSTINTAAMASLFQPSFSRSHSLCVRQKQGLIF